MIVYKSTDKSALYRLLIVINFITVSIRKLISCSFMVKTPFNCNQKNNYILKYVMH